MGINGNTLRRLRVAEDLTQSELARRVGLHSTAICRLESGARPGTTKQLAVLAEFFGVAMSDLYDPDDNEAAA